MKLALALLAASACVPRPAGVYLEAASGVTCEPGQRRIPGGELRVGVSWDVSAPTKAKRHRHRADAGEDDEQPDGGA